MISVRTMLLAAIVASPALLRFAQGHAEASEAAVVYVVAWVGAWLGLGALSAVIEATSPKPDPAARTPEDGAGD